MALLKTSVLMPDISGKVQGSVFGKSKSGHYLRNQSAPVGGNTIKRSKMNAIVSGIAKEWKSLKEWEMEAWNNMAQNVQLVNRIGQVYTPSGYNLYQKLNIRLKSIGRNTIRVPKEQPIFPNLEEFGMRVLDDYRQDLEYSLMLKGRREGGEYPMPIRKSIPLTETPEKFIITFDIIGFGKLLANAEDGEWVVKWEFKQEDTDYICGFYKRNEDEYGFVFTDDVQEVSPWDFFFSKAWTDIVQCYSMPENEYWLDMGPEIQGHMEHCLDYLNGWGIVVEPKKNTEISFYNGLTTDFEMTGIEMSDTSEKPIQWYNFSINNPREESGIYYVRSGLLIGNDIKTSLIRWRQGYIIDNGNIYQSIVSPEDGYINIKSKDGISKYPLPECPYSVQKNMKKMFFPSKASIEFFTEQELGENIGVQMFVSKPHTFGKTIPFNDCLEVFCCNEPYKAKAPGQCEPEEGELRVEDSGLNVYSTSKELFSKIGYYGNNTSVTVYLRLIDLEGGWTTPPLLMTQKSKKKPKFKAGSGLSEKIN